MKKSASWIMFLSAAILVLAACAAPAAMPSQTEDSMAAGEMADAMDDEAMDDEAMDDESMDDEAMDDETMDDESMGDEAMDDEAMDDEAMDDEAMDDEAMDDEAMDDEAMDDEAMDDEAMDDEAMDDEAMDDAKHHFRVRIENLSSESMFASPFAPGVWILHAEPAPLFATGEIDRGDGLEALAEDGNPGPLNESLASMMMEGGELHGIFNTPAGAEGPGPLLPGQAYQFDFVADSAHPNLTFATMLVQSNDLFIAPDEAGIPLFDEMMAPLTGDITAHFMLWDAGTEANEEPGAGPNQAPRQSGPDTGPEDADPTVRTIGMDDGYPPVNELVRITIEPIMMDE